MPEWQRRTYKLDANHKWKAKPGCQIFVADWGAVRFDFPQGWISVPQEGGSIQLCDATPPDNDAAIEVSVMHLAPMDWTGLTIAYLVREMKGGPEERGEVTSDGEIVEEKRGKLDIAWKETRWIDPGEKRDAVSYFCLARRNNTQILLTFDYWVDDEARFGHVWRNALDSLTVGEQPPGLGRRGPRR